MNKMIFGFLCLVAIAFAGCGDDHSNCADCNKCMCVCECMNCDCDSCKDKPCCEKCVCNGYCKDTCELKSK